MIRSRILLTNNRLLFSLLMPGVVLCDMTQATGQLPQINPEGLTSAVICGECHQAIHAVWSQSLHSNAWANKVFQAAYRRTQEADGAQSARLCLTCHAPTVRHTRDYDVKMPITKEGITCDFCHSVVGIELSDAVDPIRLDIGLVKYGPLRHAESPTHKVASSPLHTRSEFCAGCHEYKNAEGLTLLGTYSEWKSSSYAQRGIQCQNCHMPLIPGRVVGVGIKKTTPGAVNLHDISGSHDLERVREAITLSLESTDWIADRVWVNLQVANTGSGHCFPTGLPMHRALLEVTLHRGSTEVARRDIPFSMILMDHQGRQVTAEKDVFLNAARVKIDTRLKPEEVRAIEVTFRDVKAKKLVLAAKLSYEYSTETLVIKNGQEQINPVVMKFLVASVQRTLTRPGR